MTHFFDRLIQQEDGATMLEYAIMLALLSAALVASVTSLSNALGVKFTSVSTTLSGS